MIKTLRNMTEPELGELMTAMAKSVEATAARLGVEKPHFALLVFNDPEIAQYVGNCKRSDMIKALREAAERLARKQDLTRQFFLGARDAPRQ